MSNASLSLVCARRSCLGLLMSEGGRGGLALGDDVIVRLWRRAVGSVCARTIHVQSRHTHEITHAYASMDTHKQTQTHTQNTHAIARRSALTGTPNQISHTTAKDSCASPPHLIAAPAAPAPAVCKGPRRCAQATEIVGEFLATWGAAAGRAGFRNITA